MTATNFRSRSRYIVIGAGPVGLMVADALASAGVEVRVVDDGRRGAGWASGGMLGAAYEVLAKHDVPDAAKRFARDSQNRWFDFLREAQLPYVDGSIFAARTQAEVAFLQALTSMAKPYGAYPTPCSMPESCNGISAVTCRSDIAFDPRHMLSVLRNKCESQGVTVVSGQATHLATGQVTLADRSILATDQIVVATGHAGSALSHCVPELSGLVLVKGQMMAIAGSGVTLAKVIRAGRIYLVPRGDHIIVGATSNPGDTNADALNITEHKALFDEAISLCPALAGGQVVESWAGMRPMTADGLPLVGASTVEGIILACGTYRNGWLLAAGIGKTIADLATNGQQSAAILQLFAPNRFSSAT